MTDLAVSVVVHSPHNGIDRVLLAERIGADDALRGWWTTPGGKLEAGETLHDAAQRELHEETGLILPMRNAYRTDLALHRLPTKTCVVVHLHVRLSSLTNQVLKNCEEGKHGGWKWFVVGALPEPNLLDLDKKRMTFFSGEHVLDLVRTMVLA